LIKSLPLRSCLSQDKLSQEHRNQDKYNNAIISNEPVVDASFVVIPKGLGPVIDMIDTIQTNDTMKRINSPKRVCIQPPRLPKQCGHHNWNNNSNDKQGVGNNQIPLTRDDVTNLATMADTTVNAVETNIFSRRRTRNARNKVEQNSVDNIAIQTETETAETIQMEIETAVVGSGKGRNNSNDYKCNDITTPAMRSETIVDAVETKVVTRKRMRNVKCKSGSQYGGQHNNENY